jgi:hypothetical protein
MVSDEVQGMKEEIERLGFGVETDERQMMITEFFTGSIPYLAYVVFSEDLAKYMGMDREELKERFWKAILDTHFQYHKNMSRPRKDG